MRFSVFCILILTIGEPLLVLTTNVRLVIQQPSRRSLGPQWRSAPMRYRKSSHSGDYHHQKYHSLPFHYHKKPGHVPFPHGGDDFDQGYEPVNHVHLPYGKGISHAISYGKGYIPYDKVKNAVSYSHERHPGLQEFKSSEPEYEATSYTSSSVDYPSSGYTYESVQQPTYYTSSDSYNERRNDENKYYSSRSIEKDLAANSVGNVNGATDKEELLSQQKSSDLYKNVSPQPQGGVTLPAGIPSATIGGSHEGIVLRDTVFLDEYQQKLQEMTKSWPQFLSYGYQNQPMSYSLAASSNPSFSGSFNWPLNFAQPKHGYDVKEDTMEAPVDLRTMPIQTASYQTYSVPVNVAVPSVVQMVHG